MDYKELLMTLNSKTQCYKVLDYLINNQSISTFEAFEKLHITRLAARISDLENEHGVSFNRDKFKINGTYYTRYSLA